MMHRPIYRIIQFSLSINNMIVLQHRPNHKTASKYTKLTKLTYITHLPAQTQFYNLHKIYIIDRI